MEIKSKESKQTLQTAVENNNRAIPTYSNAYDQWYHEFYATRAMIEYQQCIDEGLDVEAYKEVFAAVEKLPNDDIKKKFGDVLYEIVASAKPRADYKYVEPSTLAEIKALRVPYKTFKYDGGALDNKILGAWMGRVCGCLLGKPVECIKYKELTSVLKETGNYPMHRYIYKTDIDKIDTSKYYFRLKGQQYADTVDRMPSDDDTNYVVLANIIIEKYGNDFTPLNVSQAWMDYQRKNSYCTAERMAYCNFIRGYEPPASAVYQNPYREWIGAQIRTDYYGYINPGNPELAAEMAWRDASISHVKNGIYGAMFVSAMLAVAAVTENMEDIILSGLAQIPSTSRLYEEIMSVVDGYRSGVSQEECFRIIRSKYNEYSDHGMVHTISNAMIVAASLLYGGGDYGKSICMSVETAFDTDCNGATVGSIIGMAKGIEGVPEYWTKPVNDTLDSAVFGVGTVKISDMAKKTMNHIIK